MRARVRVRSRLRHVCFLCVSFHLPTRLCNPVWLLPRPDPVFTSVSLLPPAGSLYPPCHLKLVRSCPSPLWPYYFHLLSAIRFAVWGRNRKQSQRVQLVTAKVPFLPSVWGLCCSLDRTCVSLPTRRLLPSAAPRAPRYSPPISATGREK